MPFHAHAGKGRFRLKSGLDEVKREGRGIEVRYGGKNLMFGALEGTTRGKSRSPSNGERKKKDRPEAKNPVKLEVGGGEESFIIFLLPR